jgi:uncharacterized membrane protein YqiK
MTPVTSLDPDHIVDARGIRKITEITATERRNTHELERRQAMEIARQDLAANEALLEMERMRAEAEARQRYEITAIRIKELVDTLIAVNEQRQRLPQSDAETAAEELDALYAAKRDALAELRADQEAALSRLRADNQSKLAAVRAKDADA